MLYTVQVVNDKGTDHTVWMYMLTCAFVFGVWLRQALKNRFSKTGTHILMCHYTIMTLIANLISTSLSKVLTSCLTAIKNHWIKYCEKTYEREGINYFWSIKNSTEILNKLKSKGFQASTISTYDFLRFILCYHII